MATEDARYRESSQFKQWSFSHSQLAALREDTNAKAVSSISERLSERLVSGTGAPSGATSLPPSNNASNANTPDPEGSSPSLPEFLTAAEESTLVTFYVSELLRAGDHAEFSDEIKATAAVLFRRFYITNSIMTYPPQEMLIVALFFGCKAEGAFPRISDFLKTFQREHPEEILAGEFLLFRGVRFSIDVKHPFRALRGAAMELRSLGDIDSKRIDDAERRARQILRFSPLMTDAYFHYTPSQIMMAALSLADRGLAERLIQATFHYVQPQTESEANTPAASGTSGGDGQRSKPPTEDQATIVGSYIRDRVLGTVEACRDLLHKELPERREHWADRKMYKAHILPLRKKLNKCHDPDRWNLVELQRQTREQAAKKADSDDEGAGGGGRKSVDDDAAVFGGDLSGPAATKRRKVGQVKLEDPFGGAL
ncbi:cyclin-like protein [Rhypophila decipiens]|uniref:RNA polymerase II holoenzyme cyclin-like subunit n=1 Tax=Rhypophila decipiens TaxID=261697 RepID=A0AAN6XVN0_9PEZI|nr:cyclin-like protein [Rhypophila decipiens]